MTSEIRAILKSFPLERKLTQSLSGDLLRITELVGHILADNAKETLQELEKFLSEVSKIDGKDITYPLPENLLRVESQLESYAYWLDSFPQN